MDYVYLVSIFKLYGINMKSFVGIFAIAFGIAMIILGPIAAIWSVNMLFSLAIPTTFDTWVAALIIMSIIRGDGISFTSK